MAKNFAKDFYRSSAWGKCRTSFIMYKGGLCERCLKEGIIKPGDIVHHKIYLTPENIGDPNITLNFGNLELLCLDCHNRQHSKEYPIGKDIMFDENGNVIAKKV